jgi:ABC-type branched-subunit amino acid transport system substrate-binding protein
MVAIGAPPRAADVPAFQILVRSGSANAARTGATQLVQEEAVVGIVGVADAAALDEAARMGVPYLVLGSEGPSTRGGSAYPLVHAPAARVTALVKLARARGARNFASMAPDSAAGRTEAEAFRAAVTSAGGRLVAEATYPPGATSFAEPLRTFQSLRFDALFVAENADRLELVAPALAVADLWSAPEPGAAPATAGRKPATRNILLLSTAAGLTDKLVARAGRYVQGALLAPGFFADAESPGARAFVDGFRQLYGRDPGATDAYGFDGVQILRACVESGARNRGDVLARLGSQEIPGVTGRIRFGADRSRSDPPLVYQVEGEQIRTVP